MGVLALNVTNATPKEYFGVQKERTRLKMRGKRSIFLSFLVIVCVGMLAGAGVMAVFSDTETSAGNAFAAGTLDLKVGGQDDPGVAVQFSVAQAKPGDGDSAVINIANEGTLSGAATMKLVNVTNLPGETPESEPGPDGGELGDAVMLTVKNPAGNIMAQGTVNDLENKIISLCILPASSARDVTVEYRIPEAAGNEIQGDIVTFEILFSLGQSGIVNGGFESGGLSGWNVENSADYVGVVGSDTVAGDNGTFTINPKEGGYMVRLGNTGNNQNIGNNTISQTFVAMGPQLHFAYNLCSKDYASFDKFEYKVTVETMSGTVVDSYSTTAPYGNPGGYVWTSGWKDINLDVSGYTGQQLKVVITAGGTSDTALATWAYVDELIN